MLPSQVQCPESRPLSPASPSVAVQTSPAYLTNSNNPKELYKTPANEFYGPYSRTNTIATTRFTEETHSFPHHSVWLLLINLLYSI